MQIRLLHARSIAVLAWLLASLAISQGQVTSIFLSGPRQAEEGAQVLTFWVGFPQVEGRRSVDYRVVGITADHGADIIESSGTIVVEPGQPPTPITVQVLDDSAFEGVEYFAIALLNPQPAMQINFPISLIPIYDDDIGYVASGVSVSEDAGYMDVPILRLGDIAIESSVELFLESYSARAGIDFVDDSFLVRFAPHETRQTVRVRLINNAIEDGDRYFNAIFRNPTGEIPLGNPGAYLWISDNELGYFLRGNPQAPEGLEIYEDGSAPLRLERRGDYDVRSVATVKVSASEPGGFTAPVATPWIDFEPQELQIEFLPGQSSAAVPITIHNDSIQETRERIRIEATISLTNPGLAQSNLVLRDNEFNPLPAARLCVPINFDSSFAAPLRDGRFLLAAINESSNERPYTIHRFHADGTSDPAFAPLPSEGRPGKVFERADGKCVILVWRENQRWIRQLRADGQPDTEFPEITGTSALDFAIATNGKMYVWPELRRLNADGSLDVTFAAREGFHGPVYLGPMDEVYCMGPSGWCRLTQTGELDPSFSLPPRWGSRYTEPPFQAFGGRLFARRYTYDQGSHYHFVRLTNEGAEDTSFSPIPWAPIHADAEGRFYSLTETFDGTTVERFLADGRPDRSYFSATIDVRPSYGGTMWMESGARSLLLIRADGSSINGESISCAGTDRGLMRIELNVPQQRPLIEPGQQTLRETESAGPKFLTALRAGENAASATIRYRVRAGTASPGVHYAIEAEGEARFEAGVSRLQIPISIVDNRIPEIDREFFIDFLDANGAAVSSDRLTIRNDDVGVQLLGSEGTKLRVLPIAGEHSVIYLQGSADLNNWIFMDGIFRDGEPAEIEMSGEHRFIRGYAISY